MTQQNYTTLFLDIGNVLLTNGWDHQLRHQTALKFALEEKEMNARHSLMFDTFEIGKISLDDYLNQVVFYEPRNFTLAEFKHYLFDQAKPFTEMIELVKKLKKEFGLKVIAISNEGKELMVQRAKTFHLKEIFDSFICSGFVGLRKPDPAIFQLSLDISQALPSEAIYVDDRKLLVERMATLGVKGIHHLCYEETKKELYQLLVG